MRREEAEAVILRCAKNMRERIGVPKWLTIGDAVKLGKAVNDPVGLVLSQFSTDKIGELVGEPDRDDPEFAKLAVACRIADRQAEADHAIDRLVRNRALTKFLESVDDVPRQSVVEALEDRAAALIASGKAACGRWLKGVAERLREAPS